jgi:hypothetical protein
MPTGTYDHDTTTRGAPISIAEQAAASSIQAAIINTVPGDTST